jgi:hypothetical protein
MVTVKTATLTFRIDPGVKEALRIVRRVKNIVPSQT